MYNTAEKVRTYLNSRAHCTYFEEDTDGYLHRRATKYVDYMYITMFLFTDLINPLVCLCTGGKSKGHTKAVIDLLPIFAYEGNEYRLITTKKNRIGYFD